MIYLNTTSPDRPVANLHITTTSHEEESEAFLTEEQGLNPLPEMSIIQPEGDQGHFMIMSLKARYERFSAPPSRAPELASLPEKTTIA
mmetsp:Transcript_14630/g.22675  ORF Transcript_14630/g.22675 Transcript_14630/m.22675 type:complete len:88 (-) Transcript_14630:1505-1768(-)